MEKKYELTNETKVLPDGTVLHRIRALKNININNMGKVVRYGYLGGWIESERNLSQDGNAWVGGNALVYNGARVYDNAVVENNARVCCNAKIFGNASVLHKALVYDRANIYGNAIVSNEALVYGDASICGNASVYDKARIYGFASVRDEAHVYGKALIYGNVDVSGRSVICGDAKVGTNRDYCTYRNTWSSGRWFTYTRSNGKWKVGCFYGSGDELIAKAYKDSDIFGRCYETIVRTQETVDKEFEKEREVMK